MSCLSVDATVPTWGPAVTRAGHEAAWTLRAFLARAVLALPRYRGPLPAWLRAVLGRGVETDLDCPPAPPAVGRRRGLGLFQAPWNGTVETEGALVQTGCSAWYLLPGSAPARVATRIGLGEQESVVYSKRWDAWKVSGPPTPTAIALWGECVILEKQHFTSGCRYIG